MQEEAEQVTRKLRKLWVKYSEAKGELDGAWSEWAAEKEEMLDSVRMLQQQLTLKDLVIQAFVPPEDVKKVTHHALIAQSAYSSSSSTWSSRVCLINMTTKGRLWCADST